MQGHRITIAIDLDKFDKEEDRDYARRQLAKDVEEFIRQALLPYGDAVIAVKSEAGL